jgi:hypothetical protein
VDNNESKVVFKVFHQNIRSLANKVYQLETILQSMETTHVVCLTEHWKTKEELDSIKIMNYGLTSSYCRINNVHGGASIYVHDSINAAEITNLVNLSGEMDIEIAANYIKDFNIAVVCIYRPPSGNINVFFDKLTLLLNIICDSDEYINTLILGDFNVDLLKDSSTKDKLLDIMRCSNLHPKVMCPTRYYDSGQSCLDHVYSDIDNVEFAAIKSNISDHDGQMMTINYQTQDKKNCEKMVEMRRITPAKLNCFYEYIDMYDWERIVESGKEPDQILDSVINVFVHTFHQALPIRKYPIKENNKKWVTDEIISKKFILDDIKKLCNVFPENNALSIFKDEFEVLYNKLLVCKRSNYFRTEISRATNKAKSVWNIIKYETNKITDKKSYFETSEPNQLAHDINNYFINAVKWALKPPDIPTSLQLLQTYTPALTNAAELKPFSVGEIFSLLKQIKPKATKDIYEVPTNILHQLPPSFIDVLCHTMNQCLKNGSYPQTLKKIKVVPVYKGKGPKTDFKNYRPISIIPALSKIFELGLANRLISHLTERGILAKEQHAYQSHKSTVDATRELIKTIVTQQEMGHKVAVVLCDLSKAFDLVDHELIIKKLNHYGIRGNFLKIFQSFLENREQLCEVDVNGKKGKSTYLSLNATSVPQGSIIGNYLFITLVNDLSACTINGKLVAYADDSAFIVSGTNFSELQCKVNGLLLDVKNWFSVNGMQLNPEKTNVIQVSLRGVPPNTLKIELDNINVPTVDKAKYLGFVVDSGLKWNSHIEELSKRLTKACFAISRLTKMLNDQCVRNAYFAYFQSTITYGIDMWGLAADRQRIFILQKRVIRIMARVRWDTPARDIFRELKILTVPSLYILEIAKVVRRNLHQFKRRGHNSRNRNDLLPNRHRLKKSEQCIWYIGPKIYNRLPKDIKQPDMSENIFISKLKEYLINQAFYSVDEFLNKNN